MEVHQRNVELHRLGAVVVAILLHDRDCSLCLVKCHAELTEKYETPTGDHLTLGVSTRQIWILHEFLRQDREAFGGTQKGFAIS
jgi:hypothetical protein